MRFTNHRSFRHVGFAIVFGISVSATWPTITQARIPARSAAAPMAEPAPAAASACEGRWEHPRYALDIFAADDGGYTAALEPTDPAAVPFVIVDVTWGTTSKSKDLGTLDRTTFKANFAGYGPVELTCTAQGPIDQFGRQLIAKPDRQEEVGMVTENTPSWQAVQDATAKAARMSLLVPYLDHPSEAAAITYPDLPGWLFFRTAAFCYLSREKSDGRLLIGYNRAINTAHIGFTANMLTPLANGTKLTLDIVMANMNDRTQTAQPVRYWNPLKATVLIGRSGEPVYNFKLNGRQALTSFSRHNSVLFMKGEDALQSFLLKGSAAAIRRLETCDPR